MLEEKKKYTYEELKEIINKAGEMAVENIDKKMNEASEGKNRKSMTDFLFKLQNMMVVAEMTDILLTGKKE